MDWRFSIGTFALYVVTSEGVNVALWGRSNIGNAYTAGMGKELGINSGQYQWLLTIYYISYIVSMRDSRVAVFRLTAGVSSGFPTGAC